MQYPIIETVGLTLSLAWRHKFRALGFLIIFGILSFSALITLALAGGFLGGAAGSPGMAAGIGIAISILSFLLSQLLATGSMMATVGSMSEDALGQEIGFGQALSLALRRMFNGFFTLLIAIVPLLIVCAGFFIYAQKAAFEAAFGDTSALLGVSAGVFGIFILFTWMAVCLWPVLCVAMLEGEGVSYNIARSLELTRGHRWRIFGGNVIVGLILMGLIILGQIVLYMMIGGSALAVVLANPGLAAGGDFIAGAPIVPGASWGMIFGGIIASAIIMFIATVIGFAQQAAIYAQLVRLEEN